MGDHLRQAGIDKVFYDDNHGEYEDFCCRMSPLGGDSFPFLIECHPVVVVVHPVVVHRYWPCSHELRRHPITERTTSRMTADLLAGAQFLIGVKNFSGFDDDDK